MTEDFDVTLLPAGWKAVRSPDPIDPDAAVDRIVEALDTAFKSDPQAIHALISCYVPCNRALADDPHVQVWSPDMESEPVVRPIGLINGVLAAAGLPLISGVWEAGVNSDHLTKGFCGFARYTPNLIDEATL